MNKLDRVLTKVFAVRVLSNGGVKTSLDKILKPKVCPDQGISSNMFYCLVSKQ